MTLGEGRDPSFTPAGDAVVFVSAQGDVVLQRIGQGRAVLLNAAEARSPKVSPDGANVAFATPRGVHVVPVQGGNAVMAAARDRVSVVGWSGDGQAILVFGDGEYGRVPSAGGAFESLRQGLGSGGSLSADGKHLVTWHPGGRIIAFDVQPDGRLAAERAIEAPASATLASVSWSADAAFLLASYGVSRQRLLRLGLNGQKEEIASFGDHAVDLQAHPGGRTVYRERRRDTNLYRLVTPGRAGAPPPSLALTNAPGIDEQGSIAPAGDFLAYVSDRDGTPEIWLTRRDGSAARALTQFQGTQLPRSPRWSPDARMVLFDASDGMRSRTFSVMAADGSGLREVPSPEPPRRPSGDGKWLYSDGESGVVRSPASGGRAASLGIAAAPGAWQARGDGLYFVAPGAAELSRLTPETGQRYRVFPLPAKALPVFDVAPDETWFAFTFLDQETSTIRLAQPAR